MQNKYVTKNFVIVHFNVSSWLWHGMPTRNIIAGCVLEGDSRRGQHLNWWTQQQRLSSPVQVFKLVGSATAIVLPTAGGHHAIHRGPEQSKKVEEEGILSFLLPASLHEQGHWSSSGLGRKFIPSGPLVLFLLRTLIQIYVQNTQRTFITQ